MTAHGFGLFGRESLQRLSLLSAHRRRTGTGSRVRSTAHRRLALDAVSVLCYPSPGRWKKRSIRTRSQLQNGAVYGGLGAAPSTSNLGSSRQRKSQVWPRWVPRGIACRFLVPRIYALTAVFLQMRKEDAYTSSFSSSASFNLMAPSMTPSTMGRYFSGQSCNLWLVRWRCSLSSRSSSGLK